ncbi:MAG: tetratricopeptide repeat protein [Pseudomonadota bacterium]
MSYASDPATSAVLYADVHGYSQLMGKNEAETSHRVARALTLIRTLIGDYQGQVRNVAGDGVLALFADAAQSIRFAVEVQREFRKDAVWNSAADPIAFRIGINQGSVREDEFGLRGHSINVAARIQQLAEPGGICVSHTVRQVAQETDGLFFRSMGSPVMKNIDEPIEVFAVEEVVRERKASSAFWLPEDVMGVEQFAHGSIAVLQIENLSGEPNITHLCNGVTGDIIANLTRFRDLHVIAQRSSAVFQGQSVAPEDIGKRLGVRYLAAGGFQKVGNRVRIQIELIEATSGRSIWSERYNGDLADVFAFQDEVTSTIASRLSIEVSAAESQRQKATAPSSLQAYGLILRGQDLHHRLIRESNLHARRLFEQACEVDPNYARSYVGISRTLNNAWRFNWADNTQASLEQAIEKAAMAIRLDPGDARGYAALGNAHLYKRQYEQSIDAYEAAIEFNPNDADVLAEMGHSVCVNGETDRAVALIKRAMSLNPYCPDWYLWHLGEAYFDQSDYEQAIRTLSRMQDKTEAYRMLTASHAHLGDMDEAKSCARRVLATHPEFTIDHWANVPPDRNPEPRERLIDGLHKAGLK